MNGSNESDSDSDSDTEVASIPSMCQQEQKPVIVKASPQARGKRRASVRAEPLRPDESEIKMIPKTEEESARIHEILKGCVLFKQLDKDQVTKVQDAMFSVTKSNGDTIIKQGEPGDNFYILDNGSVDVHINDENCEFQKLVTSYGPGDSFGELAIMYNAPRAATCKATSDVRLWALDRVSFKMIVMTTTIAKRDSYKSFLSRVSILSELNDYEILTIADALQEENFPDGAVICNEGDQGDHFYIIKEGNVLCKKEDNHVASLSTGSYFGEIALMTTKSRQATVVAVGDLKCLSLDRKTFKRVMGNITEILQRNMDTYNKFQAANI